MINPETKQIIQKFFIASRAERKGILQQHLTTALNDLSKRNMLNSSIATDNISKVYADELRLRFESAWDSIKRIFNKQNITFSKDEASGVEDLIKQLVNNEIEHLSKEIDSRFRQRQGPLDFYNSILVAIASARSATFPKLSAELNYYITNMAEVEMKTSHGRQNFSTDRSKVFVVHGRNLSARDAIFQFLRAIGLKPIEWSQATALSGKGSPFVGEILEAAFSNAQAVVVLITGDDEAKLRNDYLRNADPIFEKVFTPQARPNVLFEAGMAFGYHPDRTILVEIGETRPFSDIAGRHIIRINNSSENRQELAQRLKNAGCVVDISGTDWHNVGDFENCISPYNPTSELEMEFRPPFYYKTGDKIPHCPICWESNGKQIHLDGPHDIPGEKPFYKCLKCNNNF